MAIYRRRHALRILTSVLLCATMAGAQEANLLLITNRTLIDNQFIFGKNAANPPTLSKRVIDPTHRGVYGLSPTDSVIKASTSIAGGIMTGNPTINFDAAAKTIERDIGSWISDGFATGSISSSRTRATITSFAAY
jgi:hypothetical protein